MDSRVLFEEGFRALTGKSPLGWQRRLYAHFVEDRPDVGRLPKALDIPTGLGKTSVMPIWLLALAVQRIAGTPSLPRRLVYVVNRRTVVDQATDTAMDIRKALRKAHPQGPVRQIQDALCSLSIDRDDGVSPIAISTLRGELADNREWQADPSRAAIIIGTVDMIGSRLLFSGYGAGRSYGRSQSAGLLGHDSLIVHDEAHLSPAFGELIRHIEGVQRCFDKPQPLRVMELSATPRAASTEPRGEVQGTPFTLTDEEKKNDDLIRRRIRAAKSLRIVKAADGDNLPRKMIEAALALRKAKARVLVYARTPELADKVRDGIAKALGRSDEKRVGLLTGTLRGEERDDLSASGLFNKFKANPDRNGVEQSVFLVSTSAGEVGVDLDADHLICDLTTLDSMIQRLGRVNRLGRDDPSFVACIDVLDEPDEKDTEFETSRRETKKVLERLSRRDDDGHDASPASLRQLLDELGPEGIKKAFAPAPRIVPCTDILLDAWALTSVRDLPGRPPVERWLHGIESELPETTVVWRAEAKELAAFPFDNKRWTEIIDEWFDAHPILARERLRDRSDRVAKQLGEIGKRHPDAKALLVFPLRSPRRIDLPEAGDKEVIGGATLVLPIDVGGFDQESGLLAGKKEMIVKDVADLTNDADEARLRLLFMRSEEQGWTVAVLGGRQDDVTNRIAALELEDDWPLEMVIEGTLKGINRDEHAATRLIEKEPRLILAADETGATRALLSIGPARQAGTLFAASAAASERQGLEEHLGWARTAASRITSRLGLDVDLASAIAIAMQWHDKGKARIPWQRAIGNPRPERPWAKSGRHGFDFEACRDYRHEFGSVREASQDAEINHHPERDLILHLIAAHHGWARPHFEERQWDIGLDVDDEENAAVATETLRRYARLQRRFGRWGLAWFEALVKAADAIASRCGRDVEKLAS